MASPDNSADHVVLIDFVTGAPTRYLSYAARLPLGGVTFARCSLPPNPGATLGSTQLTVAIHTSGPSEIEWGDPDRNRLRRQTVNTGEFHASPADLPIFYRWAAPVKALIIALDNQFVDRTFAQAFEIDHDELCLMVGMVDPTIERFGILCDRELAEGGAAGRLYAEGLATALVVHLFRTYGVSVRYPHPITGGLTPNQLRRVTEHIEAQLGEDLCLAQLAALAGMSTHHFGEAFKLSTGVPPHRYVTGRRVHRAREILLGGERSVAEIAISLGFSSQSHMTFNFHKLTGTTPAKYRREFKGRAPLGARPQDHPTKTFSVR